MRCPKGHGRLKPVYVKSIRINRCGRCGGSWYDRDELRLLKDKESHGDYCWIDFDLWKDRERFRAARQQRFACPRDGKAMITVHYAESPITVDLCSECTGIWLDKNEYDEIIGYLDKMVNTTTAREYLKDLKEEFMDVFSGPEGPIVGLRDLDRVLYLLQLRFKVEHPLLAQFLPF